MRFAGESAERPRCDQHSIHRPSAHEKRHPKVPSRREGLSGARSAPAPSADQRLLSFTTSHWPLMFFQLSALLLTSLKFDEL
jgi:hypothetical protein